MHPTTLAFTAAAQTLAHTARGLGLKAPGFRCPPGITGAHRSIRRRPGSVSIAVQWRGRPWPAVLADLVEGVVVANELLGSEADRCRDALWEALGEVGDAGDAGDASGTDHRAASAAA